MHGVSMSRETRAWACPVNATGSSGVILVFAVPTNSSAAEREDRHNVPKSTPIVHPVKQCRIVHPPSSLAFGIAVLSSRTGKECVIESTTRQQNNQRLRQSLLAESYRHHTPLKVDYLNNSQLILRAAVAHKELFPIYHVNVIKKCFRFSSRNHRLERLLPRKRSLCELPAQRRWQRTAYYWSRQFHVVHQGSGEHCQPHLNVAAVTFYSFLSGL